MRNGWTWGELLIYPPWLRGAAYTEGSLADTKETDPFNKKGVYIGVTLEMIRNGRVQMLRAIPKLLINSCVRTRSAAIAGIFTSNSGTGPQHLIRILKHYSILTTET